MMPPPAGAADEAGEHEELDVSVSEIGPHGGQVLQRQPEFVRGITGTGARPAQIVQVELLPDA